MAQAARKDKELLGDERERGIQPDMDGVDPDDTAVDKQGTERARRELV